MKFSLILLAASCLLSQAALGAPVGGPAFQSTHVVARGADVYHMTFRAGEAAYVALEGDGDTDLDLFVDDQNGNLVASDTDGTDRCAVRFTPLWTGTFVIRVVNQGTVFNNYTIGAW